MVDESLFLGSRTSQDSIDGANVAATYEWMTPAAAARLLVCAVHLARSTLVWDVAVRADHGSAIGVRWGVGSPWDHDSAGIAKDAVLEAVVSGRDATPAILDVVNEAMDNGTTAWQWSQPDERQRGADEGPGTILTRLDAGTPETFVDSVHAFAQELTEQLDARITVAAHRLTGIAAAAPLHIGIDDTQTFLASL